MDNVQLKTEIVCYCCTCVCVSVCTRELVYIGHNNVIKLEGILRDCSEFDVFIHTYPLCIGYNINVIA